MHCGNSKKMNSFIWWKKWKFSFLVLKIRSEFTFLFLDFKVILFKLFLIWDRALFGDSIFGLITEIGISANILLKGIVSDFLNFLLISSIWNLYSIISNQRIIFWISVSSKIFEFKSVISNNCFMYLSIFASKLLLQSPQAGIVVLLYVWFKLFTVVVKNLCVIFSKVYRGNTCSLVSPLPLLQKKQILSFFKGALGKWFSLIKLMIDLPSTLNCLASLI